MFCFFYQNIMDFFLLLNEEIMNLNINFDYPKTESDLIEIFNLNKNIPLDEQIDFTKVSSNLCELIGKENFETFFDITNLPKPDSLQNYLELTNNVKWSFQADWRDPFIGISSLNSSDTIPVVEEHPQICKFVLDMVAKQDPVALKHMKTADLSKKEMDPNYDIFKIESYYTFIELIGDKIRNSTLRNTFLHSISSHNIEQQEEVKTRNSSKSRVM